MKKILTLTISFFIIIILIFSCAPKKIILRLAETYPADHPTTLGDLEFSKLVNERTNGRITIEVYHSKQLAEEKSAIEQVQLGEIDFTRVGLSTVADYIKKLNVLQMPYLYKDSNHMWKVLNGEIGDSMFKSFEEADFIGLCWFDSGSRNFYNSKKEIKTVNDMKNLKIRVLNDRLMFKLVNILGANPTFMTDGEVYSALKTGTILGAENNFLNYDIQSHYEVAKFVIVDEHTRIPDILIASKIVMDKLSKKDQDIIKQAAKDAVSVQVKLWAEKEKTAEENVKAAGSIIYYPTAEEKKTFQDAASGIYLDQSSDVQELIKKIQEIH